MKMICCLAAFIIGFHFTQAQVKVPAACEPHPSENQLRWQELEYYAFVHFSVNTYTDMAWGLGNEAPTIFNPTKLDCGEWARLCKAAGMKGIILTAKHHSGFCLWPSEYTEYSVKNCPWKNGKGDIVREMADACKANGLKLGIYLSPWDRNYADYGKPAYITYFRNQLRELLTNYGEIFEIWFDGANGGSGYYGGANETRKIDRTSYYDWDSTYKLVRKLQPNIVIWNDGGKRADLRWVGTEAGYVGEKNWSLLDSTGDVPEMMLRNGLENGNSWVPGEVNTSIRPEWFYHPKEDSKVKTVSELMDTYYNSIGRNATLLLNFPIMPDGRINALDQKAVLQFAATVKSAFAVNLAKAAKATATNVRGNLAKYAADNAVDQNKQTYWGTDDGVKQASMELDFQKPISFNRVLIQEYIELGQRVKSFTLDALVNNQWQQIESQTTIGYKRILRFGSVKATKLRLNITDAKCSPLITNLEVFNAPILLAAPKMIRNQAGEVRIAPADSAAALYYTTDGSLPTIHSRSYTKTFQTGDSGITIRSIAYDTQNKKYSEPTTEHFGLGKRDFRILSVKDSNAYKIFDGDPGTQWYQDNTKKMPVDLVVDLGRKVIIDGFKYLPDQHWWASGIITSYKFFVSEDGNEWKLVDTGEFANIKNNPNWQVKRFSAQSARFVKLQALQNTQNNSGVGYAELDFLIR